MKYNDEPVIGHHIGAEVYEHERTDLDRQLDEMAKELGIERLIDPDRRKIRIEVGDVDWEKTRSVNMRIEDFDKLVDWYLENYR